MSVDQIQTYPTASTAAVGVPEPSRAGSPAGSSALVVALVSAAAFGLSGAFAHALLSTGWSPAAIVTARLAVAGIALLPFALLTMRGRWARLPSQLPIISAYGLICVAGCQLMYFSAVERLSIGVALMLEYTSPLLLVALAWILSRRAPNRLTLAGSALSVLGLMLVLNVASGVRLDGLGVLFGLLAAVGNAAHFVISTRIDDDLPPLVLVTGGLLVGAVLLGVAGGLGWLPMHATLTPVVLLGASVPWWWPVLGVALISAALAYLTGVVAARRLGSRVASFLALAEVLFAVAWGWLLVGEQPGLHQLLGGLVMLAGVAAIKLSDVHRPVAAAAADRLAQARFSVSRARMN